mgnify:FL=1
MTTLLILAYNEKSYIYDLINDYKDSFKEILVVDDCSTDGTSDELKRSIEENQNLKVITNDKNLGAGRSFIKGINEFLKSDSKYLIKIDGDNQFKKNDVLKLKELIIQKELDFIKCDRFWEKGIEGKIPNIRYVGNAFASLLIKFTTGYSKINDPLNGLFAFSKKSLIGFNLPKLFNRYGYPFYFVTRICNKSIGSQLKIGQLKNTISYLEQKKSINPFVMLFKLLIFSIYIYYKKIRIKFKYSDYQISSLMDISSQIFLFLGLFSLYRFLGIRYFNLIGPQGSWFIVFLIFFFTSSTFLFFSLKKENENNRHRYHEL